MNSMTGFGEASGPCAGGTLSVWIRTVNHKGLSVRVNLSDDLEALADEAERQVRARIARGSVSARIDLQGAPGALPTAAALAPVARRLREIRAALRLEGAVDLSVVLSAAGGSLRPLRASATAERAPLARLLGRALDGCLRSRAREGRALARDLRKNLTALSLAVRRLRAGLPAARQEAVARVRARLAEVLGKALPEGDVLRQASIEAERADVSEELSRLEAHVQEVSRLLRAKGAVGRRLEFLAQEMNREANTLSSKCGAPTLLQAVLAAREAADRLREQAANVE